VTPKGFRPTVRKDGTLDPACFLQAGLRWVKQWLEARLSGSDPYFPIDTRYDEDPEAFVASILRDAGTDSPGAAILCRAALQLLDRARDLAPRVPPYFKSLLRLCQRLSLPQAASWFTEELATLAGDPDAADRRWGGYDHAKEIVYAALVQTPGLPTAASHESWLALMKTPRYATLALLGAGTSLREKALHLREWWHSCPATDRERDLDQMIFTALKTHAGRNGDNTVQSILRSVGQPYPHDLKDAIDRALQENGGEPAFHGADAGAATARHSRERAVYGACRVDALDAAG